MTSRPGISRGTWFVGGLAFAFIALVVVAMAGSLVSQGPSKGRASAAPSGPVAIDPATYLVAAPQPAPPLELVDKDSQPYRLATHREPMFVFFGYTHCPDVCPATIGHIGLALEAHGPGVGAVFVSVDPERDTPAWLQEYARYLPAGLDVVSGSASQVRSTADAWGVKYAKVETDVPGAYSMSHTADVFLVDGAGVLRAILPFGTDEHDMTAVLQAVTASSTSPAPTTPLAASSATPVPTPAAAPSAAPLDVTVVSSAIWSGPAGPVILTLSVDGAPLADTGVRPTVQLESLAGEPIGTAVAAAPVQPPGVAEVSFVASVPIPEPGRWRIAVSLDSATGRSRGEAVITALDPGATAALGSPAPTAHTPTLADAGGVARAVTTDPAPDLRLSTTSTTDALAAHRPFMLVVDSSRFRVSPVCGRAIIMARFLLDRWRDVAFVHLEPYRYRVIEDTAVLDGSLDAPTLTEPAAAWGIGGAPWGARSMPWTFVVGGDGIVRAKYQGATGTADVDVMLALIAAEG